MDTVATRALIHLSAFRNNIAAIQKLALGQPICAAVKANAYGHGLLKMASELKASGIDALGVATVHEGVVLREASIPGPILIYSLAQDHYSEIARYDLSPYVCDKEMCAALAKSGAQFHKKISVHLKVDTGMGRIGCPPHELPELVDYINANPHLILAGIASHLQDSTDPAVTSNQYHLFASNLPSLDRIPHASIHLENSGSLLNHHPPLKRALKQHNTKTMVRPGIIMYGYHPNPQDAAPPHIQPVMELQSAVVFLKRVPPDTTISYGGTWRARKSTLIATIPIGYGDGLPRLLSNRGYVLVHTPGHQESNHQEIAPIVGRVCMDQCMIDVGHIPHIRRGHRVTLFGPPHGELTAATLALQCNTISYEILTSVAERVPRIYIE